jgi:acyl carrier protein
MNDQIRAFLKQSGASANAGHFDDRSSLLGLGIIDSVAMVDLIAFLERSFGISVSDDDMTPENFDSIDAIASFVASKKF